MKRLNWWLYFVVAISVGLLLIYIIKMSDYPISDNPVDWATFGGFLSPLVSLITMIVFLLTIQENRRQDERKLIIEKKEELGKSLINFYRQMPVFFSYIENKKKSEIYIEDRNGDLNEIKQSHLGKGNSIVIDTSKNMSMDATEAEEKRINQININIAKAEKDIERWDDDLVKMLNKLQDYDSVCTILISSYFSNEVGIKILAPLQYSIQLASKGEEFDDKIGRFKTQMFDEFSKKSFDQIKNLNNMIDNKYSREDISSKLGILVHDIDEKYCVGLFDSVVKQELKDQAILSSISNRSTK